MKTFVLGLILLFAIPAVAGELEDLKKDLAALEIQLEVEQAKFDAARARIERGLVVIPPMQARQQDLLKRIEEFQKRQKKGE